MCTGYASIFCMHSRVWSVRWFALLFGRSRIHKQYTCKNDEEAEEDMNERMHITESHKNR